MLQDLALYAELLIFLAGTFMYGFVARELLHQRAILPGNRAIRVLALSLTLWYAGSLVDELASILLPGSILWTTVGPLIDVVRSLGWLISFPLLAHTIWRMLGPRAGWPWLVPGYLSLIAFLPHAVSILREGEMVLARVSRDVYPTFVVHVTVSTVVSLGLIVRARKKVERPDLTRFLLWLAWTLVVVEGLVILGAGLLDVWSAPLWRILVSSSGLVLGATFLYFVRRYNVLSLSLSNRSLRHFASILALLFLILIAGPALGASGNPVFHRVLAWGLLLAVLAGLFFSPVTRWATARSPRIARLLGRSISQQEIAELTAKLQDLNLSEDEAKRLTASEITRWIGTEARFASAPDPGAALLWSYFGAPETEAFNRLRAPDSDLADALVAGELHAAFPIRVGGKLEAVFTIPSSAVGGGYEDGEMESLELALSQLAATIEIRRLMNGRLAAERREAEGERLSMLGMVSASLAHELKNPLSSMKALAQTVREELARDGAGGDQVQDLDLIVEQVDRLNDVAQEVLGFSRPSPDAETTALTSIIEASAYILDHEARRRGIRVDRHAVGDGEAPGTPALWQTVVFNLLLNAIRHAPGGSTVRLELNADAEAGTIALACTNEGPPIEDDVAEHLFDPFVSGAGGTGLGLALVARRVRELGGIIELVNEPDHIVFRVEVDHP